MEISSHYYGVLALCLSKNVRFDIAKRIAYASFHVDDARIDTFVFKKKYSDELFDNREKYSRLIGVSTCHAYQKIKSLNYHSMITATVPFHYFPGCKGENFDRKLRCMQNPEALEKLITKTASERKFDPEKFGMLLHVYADTFTHQGFSGILSTVNDISQYRPGAWYDHVFNFSRKISSEGFEKAFDFVMPAYGHMQVFFSPDYPTEKWSYRYDPAEHCIDDEKVTVVENSVRFREAFEKMSGLIDGFRDKSVFTDGICGKTDPEIFKILGKKGTRTSARTALWIGYIGMKSGQKKESFAYEPGEYLAAAIDGYSASKFNERVVREVVLKDGYQETNWYKFAQAVLWYKKEFFKIMEKQGVNIPV